MNGKSKTSMAHQQKPEFDMTAISVIEPGHPSYNDMDIPAKATSSRHASTQFYNEVVTELNKLKRNALILVPLPEGILYYNLPNIFKNRGFIQGVDILISRQEMSPTGERLPIPLQPVKIKKLSDAQGRVIALPPHVGQDKGSAG